MKLLVAAIVAALLCPIALAADPPPINPDGTLKGRVLEVQNASAYTYLRLQTISGEIWAAISAAPVKPGDDVTIHDAMVMEDFPSKALGRTFEVIVFGGVGEADAQPASAAPAANMTWAGSGPGAPVPGGDAAPTPASPQAPGATPESPHGGAMPTSSHGPGGMPMSSHGDGSNPHTGMSMEQMHGMAKAGAAAEPVAKVAKADGPDARTVAEVNADRLALKDKPVAIRGTVVKVNAGVMGRTWVHLRDGTGKASDDSNDLLVTSDAEPKVGDIVVATGVVKTDVDFGSGYAYKVLVEKASFGK